MHAPGPEAVVNLLAGVPGKPLMGRLPPNLPQPLEQVIDQELHKTFSDPTMLTCDGTSRHHVDVLAWVRVLPVQRHVQTLQGTHNIRT